MMQASAFQVFESCNHLTVEQMLLESSQQLGRSM